MSRYTDEEHDRYIDSLLMTRCYTLGQVYEVLPMFLEQVELDAHELAWIEAAERDQPKRPKLTVVPD